MLSCVSSFEPECYGRYIYSIIALHDRVYRCIQFAGRLEENKLYDEKVLNDLAATLVDKLAGGLRRSSYSTREHTSRCVEVVIVPVAIRSSTTTTVCPGFIPSACISNVSCNARFIDRLRVRD